MILLLSLFLNICFASTQDFFSDLDKFKSESYILKTQNEAVEARKVNLLSKKLFWTPKVDLSLQETRSKFNNNSISKQNVGTISMSLNLFKAGADWNQLQSANSFLKAQEYKSINETLSVELKASDFIFKSLYLKDSEKMQNEFLKMKEESLKIVKDRYFQGKLPFQDVTKAEIDLSQQKAKVRLSQLDILENNSMIKNLHVEKISTNTWPFPIEATLRSNSTESFPSIEEKKWMYLASIEVYKAQKSAHWPSLDLVVQRSHSPLNTLIDKESTAMLTLSFPIWNRLESQSSIASAYTDTLLSKDDFKLTEKSINERILFLKQKIEIVRINLIEAKKNLEASEKLYQDVLKSFRLGRLSTNDLFIEQNRFLESEMNFSQGQLSFHQTLVESCGLIGLEISKCL